VTLTLNGRLMMRKIRFLLPLAFLGCGYTSVDNELVGQPKKMLRQTPIVCPDRVDVDVSLGVMQAGTGSVSTQDHWLVVPGEHERSVLAGAIEGGKTVRIHYDDRRFTWCEPTEVVRKVEVL